MIPLGLLKLILEAVDPPYQSHPFMAGDLNIPFMALLRTVRVRGQRADFHAEQTHAIVHLNFCE